MNGERAGRTVRQKNSDNKHPLASTQKSAIPHDSRSPAVAIITLQQTFGNQQVQRWFKSGLLQAKLQIGQPNDIYEQEADRVADQVMRMPDEKVDSRQSLTPLIQRQVEEEEEPVQMKREEGGTTSLTSSVESSITSLRGGGKALSDRERAYFEPRFNTDFSNVRVHEGSQAGGLAETLRAKAFTVGSDIVFGRGEYSPGTAEGGRLLAHELTHVVQQKSSRPRNIIQPDRLPGEKEPPTRQGGLVTISADEYTKSTKFRDKGKISVASSTKIIKSPEVLHARQTPKGREKLPHEYVLLHERRVEIETPSGDKAVLIIKADKYLPFDTLNANPKMSPKKAVSLPGDFCKVRWSLEGAYGTEKFKEALKKYDISGIEETVQGKKMELFLASGFYLEETLKPKNPRDPCSLKGITEKTGPAFLYFNLTDRKQYQHIVDYMDGLLEDRLKSEFNLRKKLEEEKKKKKPEKEKRPAPAKATEAVAEPEPKDTKGITLPGWLKGILIALGILALAIGVVAAIAAIIALGAEILAGAAFVAAFWAAFKIIGTVLLVIGLVRSLINRFGESKLSGVGDFFRKLGVSFLDIFAIGEMIESFTDRSLVTGKPLNLSDEEKWKRRTLGVFGIFAAVFGVRSWLKGRGGTTTTAPRAPQTEPPATAPRAPQPEPPATAPPPARPGPMRFGPDAEGYVPDRIFRDWIPRLLPTEGWKLHISASPDSAPQIAGLVLPRLRAMGVAHKVVGTPEALGGMRGTQAGKFITIYPRDSAEAKATVSAMDALLNGRGLAGPVISGERALGSSGLIYGRYGGFTKSTVTSPSGVEVPDVRGADRPPWIPDPW